MCEMSIEPRLAQNRARGRWNWERYGFAAVPQRRLTPGLDLSSELIHLAQGGDPIQ